MKIMHFEEFSTHQHDGWMWLIDGYMWLLWILVIFLVFLIIRFLVSNGASPPPKVSPRDILDRRYADGEIDEEEYERRKKQLEKE